jgi:hypothetical protein
MWPYSDEENIDGLLARIATIDGATVNSNSPIIVTQPGAYNSAIVRFDTLSPGTYLLTLVFRRGANDAGTFVEAVNIYPGQESNRWVSGGGETFSTRSFNSTDFLDASASLGNMEISNIASLFVFNPANTSYGNFNVNNQAFAFTPTQGTAGQRLRYRWTAGAGAATEGEVASGQTISGLSYALGTNMLQLTVTAPDRVTTNIYTFSINAYQLSFDLNYATAGTVPAPIIAPIGYTATLPSVAGISKNGTACLGWCTTASGLDGGLDFLPGETYTVTTNATLYALWVGEAVRNIDTSAGTWAPTGPLSPEDLAAISRLLDSAGHTVTLDFSGAQFASVPNQLFLNRTNLAGITLPASLENIGRGAFWGCSRLYSIDIPGSVTSIGDNAFINCTGLDTVQLRDGVETIGASAFQGCTLLRNFMPSGTLTSIGDNAFRDCGTLAGIIIPDSVTSIGNYAFYRCTAAGVITIGSGVTSIGTDAFDQCTAQNSTIRLRCDFVVPYEAFTGIVPTQVLVPQARLAEYVIAPGWSAYAGGTVLQPL